MPAETPLRSWITGLSSFAIFFSPSLVLSMSSDNSATGIPLALLLRKRQFSMQTRHSGTPMQGRRTGFKEEERKAEHFDDSMNSTFYYPTNTGSLGQARRVRNFMSPREPRAPYLHADYDPILTGMSMPTVLVVEDDENSLFILKKILQTKGYRVLQAWDGRQAVGIVEQQSLNLILLDLQLPRLNGLGVVRHLRQNLDFECVPVVIMTGHEPEKYRGTAIDAGCDDFLLKPIDLDRLDAVLDYFVPLDLTSKNGHFVNSFAA